MRGKCRGHGQAGSADAGVVRCGTAEATRGLTNHNENIEWDQHWDDASTADIVQALRLLSEWNCSGGALSEVMEAAAKRLLSLSEK